ncbi:hypothetical protein [Kitasatospora cineracea]|uniref:DUF3558 domain-containing protein n=1 Tax=Kitasatospora cineracea TaxID=88074 RepID=A0A8G1UKT8_9ACTN|nr:hypothetical protein [Kitasatospora cineracea]ROR45866.1 hypothetical protein EDD39_4116 [Kitasatospora cineracea]
MFSKVFPTAFSGGRRALLVAGLALAAAGCSSSGGSTDAAPPNPNAPTSAQASARTSAPASPTGAATIAVTVSGDPSAAGPAGRPADPCTVWTNAQVSAAMGGGSQLLAEGPSTERPWSCTWGSRRSYLSLRLVDDAAFAQTTSNPAFTSVPVAGVGDQAVLLTRASDGSQPELFFTVGTSHYAIEAVADRSATDASNTPAESAAEEALGRQAGAKLRG